jgi:hypothetical protein
MAIPTAIDQQLAAIDDMAASIKVWLTTIRYSGKTERDIAGLRDALQAYVDTVMAFAHVIER